jgi:hypothetical protein
MNDVAHVLLGAALVAIGILAAALADRIRGLHVTRERFRAAGPPPTSMDVIDPVLVAIPKSERARAPRSQSKAQQTTADDVVAALVAAGYKKQVAAQAVCACTAAERATIEDWTRSALRCARGATS